jgi:hypothetical protein
MGLGFQGVAVAAVLFARSARTAVRCLSTDDRRLSAQGTERAIFGPRGRGARAGSAACRLAVGPRTCVERVMGRFLFWAEGTIVYRGFFNVLFY